MKAFALQEDRRRQTSTMHRTLMEHAAVPTNWPEHSSTNLQTTLSILITDILLALPQLRNQKP